MRVPGSEKRYSNINRWFRGSGASLRNLFWNFLATRKEERYMNDVSHEQGRGRR